MSYIIRCLLFLAGIEPILNIGLGQPQHKVCLFFVFASLCCSIYYSFVILTSMFNKLESSLTIFILNPLTVLDLSSVSMLTLNMSQLASVFHRGWVVLRSLQRHRCTVACVCRPVIPHFNQVGSEMNRLQQPDTSPIFSTHSHSSSSSSPSCVPPVLERKMSTRQSREELIKKGVLKEVYDKGENRVHVRR